MPLLLLYPFFPHGKASQQSRAKSNLHQKHVSGYYWNRDSEINAVENREGNRKRAGVENLKVKRKEAKHAENMVQVYLLVLWNRLYSVYYS